MKRIFTRSLLLLGSTVGFALQAQTSAPPPPPNVLVIGREEVKVGHGADHAAYEAGWPATYAKYKYPTNYLAMTSMTGPNEAWYMVGYPSFAAMEKDNDMSSANDPMSAELKRLSKGDAEHINNNTGMILQRMPELGYGAPVVLPQMRYFQVATYRVRPGHDADFAKAATMYRDAYAKAKIDHPWATYRVMSGAPDGTYLVMFPMKSLALLDKGASEDKSFMDTVGNDGMQALSKLANDGIVSATSQIFEFSPKMSYVSKEWKAANPGYWK